MLCYKKKNYKKLVNLLLRHLNIHLLHKRSGPQLTVDGKEIKAEQEAMEQII